MVVLQNVGGREVVRMNILFYQMLLHIKISLELMIMVRVRVEVMMMINYI
jgi:hypothetical protein